MEFEPTRIRALQELEEFLPLVTRYGAERGYIDFSSRLSPYIRRRILTEREVVERVLGTVSFQQAEKFIQEIVWRTFWKGWLQQNPWAYTNYLNSLPSFDRTSELYKNATTGSTAYEFYNDWVKVLQTRNYLHNHVRMWFASIWIFTLQLPWQQGAEFMYSHLLDGDPASNTLSWRWVAGIQTKGKSYRMSPQNIEKYSRGRWRPEAFPSREISFAEEIPGPRQKLTDNIVSPPSGKIGHIITVDDLSLEGLTDCSSFALLIGERRGLSERVVEFDLMALKDFATRAEREGATVRFVSSEADLADWAKSLDVAVFAPPTVGTFSEGFRLTSLPCPLYYRKRRWDAELWPFAERGFFPFWKRTSALFSKNEEQKLLQSGFSYYL